ncbi:MAG: cation:proton antiporter [Pseudomonadales bacterium]|nr:cation:proton antiporter [Pseudomonadales bacterium]
MTFSVLGLLAAISLLAIVAQVAAWRLRLPAILFLLLAGIAVGPVFGVLSPDVLFGELLFPLVSLAVAVILFEGSMTLRFSELQEMGKTVRNLVTIGALVTWFITSLATHYFVGFDLKLAFLFGAVVVVTGPTVIVPMLRTVRPNARISSVLRWEGIIIDPLGALLAVLAFNFYIASAASSAWAAVALAFGQIVAVGTIAGLLAGFGLGQVLKRYWVPDYLRSVVTLLLVFVVFVAADELVHESGLLAVTVFGITLANLPNVDIEDILDFKETLSILLISGLFILLAARIDPVAFMSIGMGALLVLLTVMLVARPVAVMLSSLGSSLTFKEQLLIAWIGPRGIVCAAVAALFALRLEALEVPEANVFVPLAFLIILGTVVIQGLSAKSLAHWLGVRDPAPTGVLIAGGGMVARRIAMALQKAQIKAIVADSDYAQIRQARMDGLETYYGNPMSEHADRHLELAGLGKLFAMSGRVNLDAVMAMNFRPVFGALGIFELPSGDDSVTSKHQVASRFRGQHLFNDTMTYNKLAGWLAAGAEIKSTLLTAEFGLDAYMEANKDCCVPLFAVDPAGRLRVYVSDPNFTPAAGWRMISLMTLVPVVAEVPADATPAATVPATVPTTDPTTSPVTALSKPPSGAAK